MKKLLLTGLMAMILCLPSQSWSFKAPDGGNVKERAQESTSTSFEAAPGGVFMEGMNLNLQSIMDRNFNESVSGDAVQAATAIVSGIFNGNSQENAGGRSLSASGNVPNPPATESTPVLKLTQEDNLGFQHIRFTQTCQGLPVVGAEVIVHINAQDVAYQVNGGYLPARILDGISFSPDITADAALAVGLAEQAGKPGMAVTAAPSLVIYGAHLAYYYVISHDAGAGVEPGQWWYYIDAHSGDLLYRYNNIQFAAPNPGDPAATVSGNRLLQEDGASVSMNGTRNAASTLFWLYSFGNLWGIYDDDVADWEQQATNDWGANDRPAVSAGKNFENTQNYVSTFLGRNSFDNTGAFARANVHIGTNYVNAYWNGTDFSFGDGDGVTADALTTQDIAAHEYGHAITQYTSNLIYANEPGALNEAYSDILGTAVEFHVQPDGTAAYPTEINGYSDWLCGEDCWLDGTALRDLRDPQRYGQPSYYHGTLWYYGSGDNGGVHYNSGVANHALYLLAVGGSGVNDGHAYGPITGIGATNAAAVALRANYVYHAQGDQYINAREHWITAAGDLGFDQATVGLVWDAVGVLDTPPPPPGGGNAYFYNMQDWSGKDPGLYQFALPDVSTFTLIGSSWKRNIFAIDTDPTGSTIYAISHGPSGPAELGTIDKTTGAYSMVASLTGLLDTVTGLTVDPTTGIYYVSDASHLYTLDVATGALTLVGSFSGYSLVIDIAIDSTGQMYGHDISADQLFTVDKATGVTTAIGSTGWNAGYAQGMDFDLSDDTLYLWLYVSGGTTHFCSADLSTGACTELSITSGECEGFIDVAGCQQVNDGGFENGPPPASAWTEWSSIFTGSKIVNPTSIWGIPAYEGTYGLWVGGYSMIALSNYAEQTIPIPADGTTLSLQACYYRVDGDDADLDTFYIKVNGITVFSKPMIQANNTQPNWVEETVDISAYAGQTVILRFGGESAGYATGNVLVDDIRICSGSAPCTYTIDPAEVNLGHCGDLAGGAVVVAVDASDASCAWTVEEDLDWVTVDPMSGTGDGTVTVTVDPVVGFARSGTITIAGQTFTINQSASVDFTGDGCVKQDDLTYFAINYRLYRTKPAAFCPAIDLNCDGTINDPDAIMWKKLSQQYYGKCQPVQSVN